MKEVKQIGVIGRTAFGTSLCDGQTIKTRILVEELNRRYPDAQICVADTYNYKKRAWDVLRSLFVCMKNSQVVFVLLSRNGMRTIFPVVNFLNLFFRRPVFHDCIGGSLDTLAERYPNLKKQIKRFDVNWVESPNLKKRLEDMGIHNAEYLPNFKRLTVLPEQELKQKKCEPYSFCTFSRVNEDKGIGRAAEAVIQINQAAEKRLATLDIYGPVEGDYGRVLDRYLAAGDGAVRYMGVADQNKSVETLKKYDTLLFPTTFAGEGFPGTLIDAFCAGLPVIATDWHFNGEIITEGVTGFLYPADEPWQLRQRMEQAVKNPEAMLAMGKNCLREAARYDADTVMQVICERIERAISS